MSGSDSISIQSKSNEWPKARAIVKPPLQRRSAITAQIFVCIQSYAKQYLVLTSGDHHRTEFLTRYPLYTGPVLTPFVFFSGSYVCYAVPSTVVRIACILCCTSSRHILGPGNSLQPYTHRQEELPQTTSNISNPVYQMSKLIQTTDHSQPN